MVAAFGYLRVSTRQQDLEAQRLAIRRAASARGDRIVDWYAEKRTGTTLARPELERLRADVRGGGIRKLYVFRVDRLARSGIRDVLTIVEEFRAHGCAIASVADGFSLDGPAADVVLAVIAWGAQMERAALGERIAASYDRVKASGGRWGRPPRMGPELLAKAKGLEARGKTIREISVALKVPRTTVHDALREKGEYSGRLSSFLSGKPPPPAAAKVARRTSSTEARRKG